MQIKKSWQRTAMRRAAIRYAAQLWPVMPGAYLTQGRYLCGPLCPTVACHPALDEWELAASCDPEEITDWWADEPFSVLFATGRSFDGIEVSARLGQLVLEYAGTPAPVIVSPTGRWTFLVAPGNDLCPELDAHFDVVRHGWGSWISAPPTRTPEGPVRWAISPTDLDWGLPSSAALQRELVRFLPHIRAVSTFATSCA